MIPVYNQEKLKRAQEASLAVLLEVDRICRAHGCEYLMDAGTLLGAVRHKGFIPWDDDIDIAMTRENFEKFRKIAPEELPGNMELILPDQFQNGRAFYDFTPRIIYKYSKRHEATDEMAFYEGKLNHLWVDIFILDVIPDGQFSDRMTRFLQKVIYGFSMTKRFRLDMSRYSKADRRRVEVLTAVGRHISMPSLFRAQEKLAMKYRGRKSRNFYYSNYQPDYLQVTVRREWSEKTTELPFEGHSLMAPAGYHEVLKEIYGDYMQLPPEESRCPSHSDSIDVFPDGIERPTVPETR